jgi:UDP-N-acetylmuramyl pentapeptide synthase
MAQQAYQHSASPEQKNSSEHYATMEDLLGHLTQSIVQYVRSLKQTKEKLTEKTAPLVILVKGSRFTKMERVIAHFVEKEIPCY